MIFIQIEKRSKLHTLYDITTQIPAFIHITAATVNDMNAFVSCSCIFLFIENCDEMLFTVVYYDFRFVAGAFQQVSKLKANTA